MTSSLPNFLSETPAGSASAPVDPGLQCLLEALPGPMDPEGSTGAPVVFATLLAPPSTGTAAAPLPAPGFAAPLLAAAPSALPPAPAALRSAPAFAQSAPIDETGEIVPMGVAAESTLPAVQLDERAIEEIAAILTALLQAVAPAQPPVPVAAGGLISAETADTGNLPDAAGSGAAPDRGAPTAFADTGDVSWTPFLAGTRAVVRIEGRAPVEIALPAAGLVPPASTNRAGEGAAGSASQPAIATMASPPSVATAAPADLTATLRQAVAANLGHDASASASFRPPSSDLAATPTMVGAAAAPATSAALVRPVVAPIAPGPERIAAATGTIDAARDSGIGSIGFRLADGTKVEVAVFAGQSPTGAASPAPADARAVNIAASAAAESSPAIAAAQATEKTFLTAANKPVKASAKNAGIGVAESPAAMSSPAFAQHRALQKPELPPVAAPRLDLLPVAARTTDDMAAAEQPAPAPAPAAFAQRAVQTVVTLSDAQFAATLNRTHSVNLRLKFAGEDLAVRVELREGAVHADFRTDSPELRARLQGEWQAIVALPAEHRVRFADPVFGPANSGGASASSDQSFRHQTPGRAPEEFAGHQHFAVRPVREATAGPAATADAVVRAPLTPPTALRLSVLA